MSNNIVYNISIEIFRNKNISVCFFYLVSMSGKLVEYSSHAVKLLLSWIPHAFRWMPRAIHSESHNSQTKCFDQFAVFCNSVSESSSLVNIWHFQAS